MTIHLAADHAGFELKQRFAEWLLEQRYTVIDHGASKLDSSDNYPDFVIPAAKAVAVDESSLGVVIGGTGQGEGIAANRIKGARAFVYYGPMKPIGAVDVTGRLSEDEYEIVKLSRDHNNSNILSVGARFVDFDELVKVFKIWAGEEFSGHERHLKRIQELDKIT